MVKSNAGKTYPDAIVAYENILKQKKAVVLILLLSSTFDKKRVTAIVALSVISLTIIVGATVPLAKAESSVLPLLRQCSTAEKTTSWYGLQTCRRQGKSSIRSTVKTSSYLTKTRAE